MISLILELAYQAIRVWDAFNEDPSSGPHFEYLAENFKCSRNWEGPEPRDPKLPAISSTSRILPSETRDKYPLLEKERWADIGIHGKYASGEYHRIWGLIQTNTSK